MCQSLINLDGKLHQHVVKCTVCNEATVKWMFSVFFLSREVGGEVEVCRRYNSCPHLQRASPFLPSLQRTCQCSGPLAQLVCKFKGCWHKDGHKQLEYIFVLLSWLHRMFASEEDKKQRCCLSNYSSVKKGETDFGGMKRNGRIELF